jgi:Lrp/AsnC family transcriptional regulator, leucine-responsive regulatory protein
VAIASRKHDPIDRFEAMRMNLRAPAAGKRWAYRHRDNGAPSLAQRAIMSAHMSPLLADRTNLRILQALVESPRMSTAKLAKWVGMSAPAVRERVRRLEESGIIRGCRLDLDPAQLGFSVSVMVRIKPMPGQLQKVIELAQRTSRVVECHRVTGEDCVILRMHLESIATLDHVLDAFLVYGQTTTSIIQSSPVSNRSLPLTEKLPPRRQGRKGA